MSTSPGQRPPHAIVTGANSGLGFEVTRGLARAGFVVIMACRSTERGAAARAALLDDQPAAQLQVEALDLADLAAVRAFAERLSAQHERIECLINNAGVMALPYGRTADGFERQLGTNHLGHFALTGLLMPLLRAAPGSRVVNVASKAAERPVAFDPAEHLRQTEQGYGRWRAYSRSKLANLLFTRALTRRLCAAGIEAPIALAAHPGAAATSLFGKAAGNALARRLNALILPLIAQSPARGALPILRAATDPQAAADDYFGPDGLGGWYGKAATHATMPDRARDDELAGALWTASEAASGVSYP